MIGFVVMHYTAGIILSVVFQLAHITTTTTMPQPSETGTMKNTWAIHQLFTTGNFAPKNWVVNWFTGGLNHQIEHHIFPYISHIHYKNIGKIVKQTARNLICPTTSSKLFAPPLVLTINYSNHWQKNQSQYNLDDERSIIESGSTVYPPRQP